MDTREAQALLNLSAAVLSQDAADQYDEIVFARQRDLLRHEGSPAWLAARRQRLGRLAEASRLLGLNPENPGNIELPSLSFESPVSFLRSYEHSLSALRLAISRAANLSTLCVAMDAWQVLLAAYARAFRSFWGESITPAETDVKQADAPDTAWLIGRLVSGAEDGEFRAAVSRELRRISTWPV